MRGHVELALWYYNDDLQVELDKLNCKPCIPEDVLKTFAW